jgi:hypothetical protein
MAAAIIAAARQRLIPNVEHDVNDDLGTQKQVPGKEERIIDLCMNIRYNLRG